jgi:hypothetical protein
MARLSDLTTTPSKQLNKQIDYPSPESLRWKMSISRLSLDANIRQIMHSSVALLVRMHRQKDTDP